MTREVDGSVRQSGLYYNPDDYAHERMAYPVLGVVVSVYMSDSDQNYGAIPIGNQRGSRCECQVLVFSDGNNTPWVIPNAVVLPSGASGVDDYQEAIPRPCTQMIDGSEYGKVIDVNKVDGDWCVVSFIGGSIEQPFISNWWPHPGNKTDPATGGFASGALAQGRRFFKRYQGAKFTITNKGSLVIDTNESGYLVQGDKDGLLRKKREEGGDIQVDIKKSRKLEVNFNKPAPDYDKDPSLPQLVNDKGMPVGNPPKDQGTREDEVTRMTLDKALIQVIAGEVVKILAHDKPDDSVLLGDDDSGSMDHAVKGETFKDLYNKLVTAFNAHKHNSAVGPTAPPTADPSPSGPIPADSMTDNELSPAVMVKR